MRGCHVCFWIIPRTDNLTTGGPPQDHRSTVVDRQSTAGSCRVLGRGTNDVCFSAHQYFQRTGKKIFINANDTTRGDFKTTNRKPGNIKDTSSMAMLAYRWCWFDGVIWKNYETLKKQCDDLIVKLNQTEFKATTYKRGLTTVEEQLVTYRKNEVLFNEEVAILKREVACKDYEMSMLKSEFEKVKQEKEGIEFKIEKFDNASKSLDKLLGSQITDKSKKGLGYNAVPPPHHLIYNAPTKLDLSYSGFDEFTLHPMLLLIQTVQSINH
ncbi:hypothetical protein Tco_1225969 [Tanacetum coccineum]